MTCGDCRHMDEFYLPMQAHQCTKQPHCWVLPDFHGCPRFEKRKDWADNLLTDLHRHWLAGDCAKIIRDAAQAAVNKGLLRKEER